MPSIDGIYPVLIPETNLQSPAYRGKQMPDNHAKKTIRRARIDE